MGSIILPASIISIYMLVCFPCVSYVNPLVNHFLSLCGEAGIGFKAEHDSCSVGALRIQTE